jgi:SAM-dependent MidA family methyltransferase
MDRPLARWIRQRIEAEGPISFERFMDWALYHPEHGYYSSGRAEVGRDSGDFTTAPHLSGIFARCLSRVVQAADETLGAPSRFVLAEGGPGEGRLALGLLSALRCRAPDLYSRVAYALDERSLSLLCRQREVLEAHRARVSAGLPEAPFEGVYLSNELLDAFPVHRMAREKGELREVHVDIGPEGFREVLLPPSRPEVVQYLEAEGIDVHEGCQVEVNLRAIRWIGRVARRLERGYVVTVDYGDEAARLYRRPRPAGTCAAYRSHRLQGDLLMDPGLQDLTAHVNFTAIRRAGARWGLASGPLLTQREFLFRSGLAQEMEELGAQGLSELELLQARRDVAPLLLPNGMGDTFKVLVQARGAPLIELGIPCQGG